MTLLEELVERYPSAQWNWDQLSMNRAISFQFIAEHKSLSWNNCNVSRNVSVTENDIVSSQFNWNYSGLFANPNLSFAFYKKYMIDQPCVLYIDWALLSSNPSVTTMDIITYPTHPWIDKFLSANPNITSSFILNEGINRNWYAPSVSANPGIVKRDIVKSSLRSLFEWDYLNLSINPNLPLAYVDSNIEKNWNWFEISKTASMMDLERFHNFKWNHDGMSMNDNMTMDYILSRNDVSWNKQSIIMNPSIKLNNVYDHLEWFCMDMPAVKKYLSSNPNISFEWINDNINYVDWDRLSNNILM